MSLTHMAISFVLAYPCITSGIIGLRAMWQFDVLLAGAGVTLDDALLDRIDGIVPPGTDVASLGGAVPAAPN
jgi:aryl-alcohol dehydrogenase (NADP+)